MQEAAHPLLHASSELCISIKFLLLNFYLIELYEFAREAVLLQHVNMVSDRIGYFSWVLVFHSNIYTRIFSSAFLTERRGRLFRIRRSRVQILIWRLAILTEDFHGSP
jgi:hypothetical protein